MCQSGSEHGLVGRVREGQSGLEHGLVVSLTDLKLVLFCFFRSIIYMLLGISRKPTEHLGVQKI